MYKCLLIIFIIVPPLFSQSIYQKFFDALIYDKPEVTNYINKDELKYSTRLGIEYDSIKNKILIGYELPGEIKSGIQSGKYQYEIKELPLADAYTEVTFTVPDAKYSRKYFFNDGFVTNSTYYSRLWEKKESKYFTYRLEEPKYFNDYCIMRLDEFVDMIADTLGFTISEKRILEKQKIGYNYCVDEKGVEKITGFNAKGMALLGSDEVVTSYQTHFHEVAHILINYKLKHLGLYTLPFFMEGFAVAVGGRGGMAPRVVTDLGYFLQKSGQLTYDSILTNEGFYNNDASMSYAVTGLYNTFLLNELGGEKYLELYRVANGSLENVKNLSASQLNISEYEKFDRYLTSYNDDKLMYVDENDTIRLWIEVFGTGGDFIKSGNFIKFFILDKYFVGFTGIETNKDYISRKYLELRSTNHYSGMKYSIIVNEESISIYDLFNDELIYSYNIGLSTYMKTIPKNNGYYNFFIKSELFGDNFVSDMIIIDNK